MPPLRDPLTPGGSFVLIPFGSDIASLVACVFVLSATPVASHSLKR
jgi:hypothetical protein